MQVEMLHPQNNGTFCETETVHIAKEDILF